jgi:putative endonuclease
LGERELEPSLAAWHSAAMRDEKQPAVYIMASRYRGTLYIGVTSALYSRVLLHKSGDIEGFTAKYGVKTLVWYEHHATMEDAIRRETQMKAWKRSWKIELEHRAVR